MKEQDKYEVARRTRRLKTKTKEQGEAEGARRR